MEAKPKRLNTKSAAYRLGVTVKRSAKWHETASSRRTKLARFSATVADATGFSTRRMWRII